jgi:TolB-like protein
LDKLNFAFEELGSREVKNISRPIEVYRVELNGGMPRNANQAWSNSHRLTNYAPRPIRLAAAAIAVAAIAIGLWTAVFREMTASASPPNVTVAVLPFMAKRPEPNDLALAELVTNNLSRALRRESNLPVVNVEAATNSAVDTRSIGRSLNAAYIVKGEIQHLGDHLEISVQLLEATSGRNLWNDRLTVETTAIDNVEATAPLRLVSSLGGALYAANLARFSAPPPSNAGPLELTMHGKAVWSRDNNTMSGTLEARKWFDKALRLDPNFIPALSGRFQTLVYEQDFDPNADGDRIVREMDQLAFHMVNLDNTRPRLWIWRAEALMRQGKYEAAEAAVSQAERLSVRVPDSLSYRAELLILTGRPNEAVGPLNEEVALGLQDQQELGSVALLRCRAMLALGRYDESIRDCERNVALDDWWLPHVYLLAAYTLEGDVTKSASEKAALSKLRPGISIDDVKKHYFSSAPKFVEQADAHLLAGLRKAGIPER